MELWWNELVRISARVCTDWHVWSLRYFRISRGVFWLIRETGSEQLLSLFRPGEKWYGHSNLPGTTTTTGSRVWATWYQSWNSFTAIRIWLSSCKAVAGLCFPLLNHCDSLYHFDLCKECLCWVLRNATGKQRPCVTLLLIQNAEVVARRQRRDATNRCQGRNWRKPRRELQWNSRQNFV